MLGLVQARCAEISSGGPVAQEGADTCTAAGDNGLADAVDGVVHSVSFRDFQFPFCIITVVIMFWKILG